MTDLQAKNRLMVAIDVQTPQDAREMVARIEGQAGVIKVGLELIFAGGIPLVEEFKSQGYQVFLDAKLFDIPNTVKGAVGSILTYGADYLTVHAYPQNVAAALEASKGSNTQILGVTVLTSMTGEDLIKAGYGTDNVAEVVAKRVQGCMDEGLDGFVCSPLEAASLRAALGPSGKIVTPGVRPKGADVGDQKRIMTPFDAIKAGASHLVVGRPITQSDTPAQTAASIVAEIAEALS